jgi:uncharacterized membrane protein YhiD involved in acid resistance
MIPTIFIQLAVALGLGLLVGLQRERVALSGVRELIKRSSTRP